MEETEHKAPEEIGRVIAEAREAKGLNQSELARAVGVTPQAVQKWENGTSTPRASKVKDIADALGLPPSKLMASMIGGIGVLGAVPVVGAAIAKALQLHADDDTNEIEVDRIPYWDAKGSCGGGFLNYEQMPKGHLVKEIGFFKKYGLKPENAVAIYADGNSMANFIVDGDIVIFDKSRTDPRSGKIFLIDHPDGLRIKQLRREIGGAWVLESLNPDKTKYPDERIEPAQGSLLKIYGEFVYRQGG
ncbi:XRE family transcriptional regulator [Cupriavidus metallidurans]|uniref:XRE family transcriptional regulator n=1 Tax=Cupriavidus metallidurans TaxID=119219 RepID=UPI00165034E6|nr:LexA family transcriptional regulator [Cupriavidus metallidurans]